MEYLEANLDWLDERLKELGGNACDVTTCNNLHYADSYVLFDCPGQVELFTHHSSLRNILHHLEKQQYRVYSQLSLFSVLTLKAMCCSSRRFPLLCRSYKIHFCGASISLYDDAVGITTRECFIQN